MTQDVETSQPETVETQTVTASPEDQVIALLNGEDLAEPSPTPDGGDAAQTEGEPAETQQKSAPPKSLEALAETLGTEVKNLYEIEVPFDVGDQVEFKTLGEMKDSIRDLQNFEVDKLEFEEKKSAAERDALKAQQELADLIQLLPKSAISRDLVEQLGERRRALVENEERQTLATITEWKDGDVRAKDESAMTAHLREYGLPSDFLETNVLDHRVRAFIRDATLRKQRVDKALERAKLLKRPGHSPSRAEATPAATAPKRPGRVSRVDSQTSEVAALLNGTN